MKLSRISAAAATISLVAASALLVAGPAQADDSYVTGPFTAVADGDPYIAGWFSGDVSPDTGSTASTTAGLEITGAVQLLNGTTPTTGLGDLVNGARMVSTGSVAFQIPLFTDGTNNTGFTTLVPDNFGGAGLNPLAGWTTTNAFGTFAAGSSHTIPEYETELALLPDYEILGYGFIVIAGETGTVASVTWDGNTSWFLPTPTISVNPTSISTDESSTAGKGVTVTATGLLPGEAVTFGIGAGQSGGDVGTGTADVNGSATFTYVASSPLSAGAYSFGVFGNDSGYAQLADFTVSDQLAATGVDSTPLAIGAGSLLLIGAALAAFSIRRRRVAAGA